MPKTFGPYVVGKKLGAGVYLARGPEGNVVLKLARRDDDGTFAREAHVLSRLRHEHIVAVRALGEHDGRSFLALEHIDGADLAAVLAAAGGPLDTAEALQIARDVSEALGAAHASCDEAGRPQHLVHRDVSPSNILIAKDGQVKLADFGLAKVAGSARTDTGVIKGKFEYLAPEQAHGLAIDGRADLFALGLVLFELLTGRRAYASDDDFELIELARECRLPALGAALPAASAPLVALLEKLLACAPEARFQNAPALTRALLALQDEDATVVRKRLAARVLLARRGLQGAERD